VFAEAARSFQRAISLKHFKEMARHTPPQAGETPAIQAPDPSALVPKSDHFDHFDYFAPFPPVSPVSPLSHPKPRS